MGGGGGWGDTLLEFVLINPRVSDIFRVCLYYNTS